MSTDAPTLPERDAITPPERANREIYPPLTDGQVARMTEFGVRREFAAGEVVFEHGQKEAPFFFLESGAVRIVERSLEGDRQLVRVDPGTFIGDIAMFTGEPAVAACETVEPVVAWLLDRESLRRLVTSHSDVGDLVLRALMARRDWMRSQSVGEVRLIGPAWSEETHRLRTFLDRNQIPLAWHDTEACTESCALTDSFGITADDFPLLISGGKVHRRPKIDDIANCLGLRPELSEEPYDLAVIGAGPGGLGAAVYGASEGLSTVVFEDDCPGGQAGTSSKIENYLGFVTGISGQELTKQATLQARKFGAVLTNPTAVTGIVCDAADEPKRIELADGRTVRAWAVVIAAGAHYRRLPDTAGCDRYEGRGVYYAAGPMEARQCAGSEVVVVGGGNSAGQAAVFLSEPVDHVHVVIRSDDLGKSMSDYLVGRLNTSSRITVHTETTVGCVDGDERLRTVRLDGPVGAREIDASAVFVMIGASPRTEWIDPAACVGLDEKGFVVTGTDAQSHEQFGEHWSGDRVPHLLETTRPGVFAVGDVRAGSVKRVASAVGEGAMAISFVHAFLSSDAIRSARSITPGRP